MNERVVITGIGCISAGANNIPEFLNLLKSGKSVITKIDELEKNNFGCQIGGIPDTDSTEFSKFIDDHNLKHAGMVTKLTSYAAMETWKDAGLENPEKDSKIDYDTGCIIGSINGNIDIYTFHIHPLVFPIRSKKLRSIHIEQAAFNAPSVTIAGLLALGNMVSSNSSACSSSTESIILGYERIMAGRANRMIVGGCDCFNLVSWAGSDSLGLVTKEYNQYPQKAICSLSQNASGTVLGAGAGVIILESLNSARKRGAKIYAELLGGITNCGAQRNGGSMTIPNPISLKKCIGDTIDYCKINRNNIDLVSGHLNSTPVDFIEIDSWVRVLKRHGKNFPFINAIKSYIGYCLGAEGVLDTIAAALELKYQFIFPNLNSRPIHESILKLIDKEKIPEKLIEDYPLNYVIKGSFGFGDVNACIILKKYFE